MEPAGSMVEWSDEQLVAAAQSGNGDAFAALYERYFDRVYDFVVRTVRDRDEAADVVQDTFIRAMNAIGGLASGASFKSWLFTIARNTALNRLERSKRTLPLTIDDEEGETAQLDVIDNDRFSDPESAAEAKALSALVWESAAALDPKQLTLLDLHVRQGLDSAEIAEVLGVTKNNAYVMVNRLKGAVEEAIGALALFRFGKKECPALAKALIAVGGEMSPDAKKAIDKHLKQCENCRERKRKLIPPMVIFGAFAPVQAPPGLRTSIAEELARQWPGNAAGGGGASGDGGTTASMVAMPAVDGGRRWPRRGVLASIAAGMLLFLAIPIVMVSGGDDDVDPLPPGAAGDAGDAASSAGGGGASAASGGGGATARGETSGPAHTPTPLPANSATATAHSVLATLTPVTPTRTPTRTPTPGNNATATSQAVAATLTATRTATRTPTQVANPALPPLTPSPTWTPVAPGQPQPPTPTNTPFFPTATPTPPGVFAPSPTLTSTPFPPTSTSTSTPAPTRTPTATATACPSALSTGGTSFVNVTAGAVSLSVKNTGCSAVKMGASPSAGWILASPAVVEIGPFSTTDVTISAATGGLPEGVHSGTLTFVSDDASPASVTVVVSHGGLPPQITGTRAVCSAQPFSAAMTVTATDDVGVAAVIVSSIGGGSVTLSLMGGSATNGTWAGDLPLLTLGAPITITVVDGLRQAVSASEAC